MARRPATHPDIDPQVWRVGAVTSLGSVLAALDITVVNVAVDPIARDLGADLPSVSWVLTSYLLALAVVVPTSGWLSRTFGLRTVFLAAMAGFLVASVLCAAAPTLEALVAARVLQGVAGAVLAPVGQMIVVRITPRESLGHVMGVLTVPVLVAPVFGPVVGGLLIDSSGWPSIFLLNLPICVVALVLGRRMLPRDEPLGGARLDVLGLLLAGPGLALLLYGLAESGSRPSPADPHVLVPVVAGAGLLALFTTHALRHPAPLLDLRLVRFPVYRWATVTGLVGATLTLGSILLLPLYLQGPRGESTTTTALVTSSTALGVMVVLRAAGRAADRHGGGPVALVGVALLALGTAPLLGLDGDTPYPLLLATFFVRGIGVGLLTGPVTAAAMRSLPPVSVPDASVQLNVVQRVGGSLGTAVLVVLLQMRLADVPAAQEAAAYGWVHRWVLLMAVAIALPAYALLRAERAAKTVPEVLPVGATAPAPGAA